MDVPPGPASRRSVHRVVAALNREWTELVDQAVLPAAWVAAEPALAGYHDLAEVERRAGRGCDEVLHALLRQARAGDRLAARTVLQALLGRVVALAGRDPQGSVDEYVAALWCVVVRYPLTTRPVRIAANLALDTMKTVHREVRWWPRGGAEVQLPGDDLDLALDAWQRAASLDHQASAEVAAAQVIDAGRRLQILDEPTRVLLRLVYVEGLTGAEAASRHGSTAGSVRVRCSRAVRKLSAQSLALAEAA